MSALTFAIDPEKIVGTRDLGSYCEIEYAETYDRRRQPIVYQLTTSSDLINALIDGTYDGKEYLVLTVVNPLDATTFTLNLQERYIVDIRPAATIVNKVKADCLRVEYVPGSFVPKIIYVSGTLGADVFDFDAPADVTTTVAPTTEAPTTEAPTTTVAEPTTTEAQ